MLHKFIFEILNKHEPNFIFAMFTKPTAVVGTLFSYIIWLSKVFITACYYLV